MSASCENKNHGASDARAGCPWRRPGAAHHDDNSRRRISEFIDVVLLPNLQPSLNSTLAEHQACYHGRRVLITGANRGYGYAAAEHFARAGARVIMACRSGIPETAERMIEENEGMLAFEPKMEYVDLVSLEAIRNLAKRIAMQGDGDAGALDIVVLNAAEISFAKVFNGYNRMFVINYLANIVLLRELEKWVGCGHYARRLCWFWLYDSCKAAHIPGQKEQFND